MKILLTAIRHFSALGVSPHQAYLNHPFSCRSVLAFLVLSSSTVSCAMYFFRLASTFIEYTYSIYGFSSMFVATAILLIISLKMRQFFETFYQLEDAINERLQYPASQNIYEKVNPRVENCCKIIFFVIMKISFPVAMSTKFVFGFIMYFTTDSGNDVFELPLPFWYPFDWKHPIGFVFATVLQVITMFYVNTIISACLSAGVGIYMWAMSVAEDVKNNLISINELAKWKRKRSKLLKLFSVTVDFHSTSKKLVHLASNVAYLIFMVLIIWSISSICGAMLIMNTQITRHEADNLAEMMIPMVELFWSFVLVFINCELAGRIGQEFDNMDYLIDQFDWYSFPLEVQRLLPIIMANSQQPVGFTCFGSVMCNRETFKKVVNHGFSYFMVLRELLK